MKNVPFLILSILTISCKSTPEGYQGQGDTPIVPTIDLPIQRQWKGIWALEDSTIFFTNNFDGGRLNGVVSDGDDHYTVLITAENTPINHSPWYAFKIWTIRPREVTIQLTYQHMRSRYYPKVSSDGINFRPLDSSAYTPINPGSEAYGIESVPESAALTLSIGEDPIWVVAQELYTSKVVKQWIDSLAMKPFVRQSIVGRSKENKPLHLLEIGNPESKKALIIISRQHPPEVTGFLAMKSFVETISNESEPSTLFRKKFITYVVPLMNPDGVDNGHWRHNMGGVDLNRDWHNFNQPETAAIRDFLNSKKSDGYDFVFGGDFHSTWDDVYYPLDSTLTGEKNSIIYRWIRRIATRLPQKKANVIPSKSLDPTMVSRNYFYLRQNMPSIVFELGDNTPRDFLKKKGQVAAEELTYLLMSN